MVSRSIKNCDTALVLERHHGQLRAVTRIVTRCIITADTQQFNLLSRVLPLCVWVFSRPPVLSYTQPSPSSISLSAEISSLGRLWREGVNSLRILSRSGGAWLDQRHGVTASLPLLRCMSRVVRARLPKKHA